MNHFHIKSITASFKIKISISIYRKKDAQSSNDDYQTYIDPFYEIASLKHWNIR